jgi:hypothetical protein
LSGKTELPFCTYGGDGLGKVAKDIAKLCSMTIVPNSFEIYGSGGADAQAKLSSWLREIGVINKPYVGISYAEEKVTPPQWEL